MADLFGTNQRFKDAIEDINNIASDKLPLILKRIIQNLHRKNSRAFNPDEENQLQQVLKINEKQLTSVLDSVSFIFEQASYFNLSSDAVKLHLEKVGLSTSVTSAFGAIWKEESPSLFSKLQSKSIVPMELESVEWRLHLQMGQSSLQKLKNPTALFELGLQSTSETLDEVQRESLKFEFNHEELYEFFEKLETIQEQLDNLSR